jgi:hypothetical protein
MGEDVSITSDTNKKDFTSRADIPYTLFRVLLSVLQILVPYPHNSSSSDPHCQFVAPTRKYSVGPCMGLIV